VLEGSAVDGHPTYDNWVTADGDCVIVKAYVSTPKDYLYELVEFERQGG
jgi:hypothetical protein